MHNETRIFYIVISNDYYYFIDNKHNSTHGCEKITITRDDQVINKGMILFYSFYILHGMLKEICGITRIKLNLNIKTILFEIVLRRKFIFLVTVIEK